MFAGLRHREWVRRPSGARWAIPFARAPNISPSRVDLDGHCLRIQVSGLMNLNAPAEVCVAPSVQ